MSLITQFLIFVSLAICACTAYNAYDDIGDVFPFTDAENEEFYKVPEGFTIGAGSSAYQTEGAWNEDGKGENVWDYYFHYQTANLSNGDVACDSYHHYKEDVRLVKNMQLNFYRISLSWSRLLPNGTTDYVNQKGVDFYNNFINEMINNSITPVITLYHGDLPQALQLKGGWLDSSIQDYFMDYAKFAFETFGDRVKWWTTLNEPYSFCALAYEGGVGAPEISLPGVGQYICGHNAILAHAKAYQAYYANYSLQGGQVGWTLSLVNYIPLNVSSTEDQAAAEKAMEFYFAWFADPVIFGKYPDVMRTAIDANSKAEGRNVSRLPEFTTEEKKMLQASTDFLGINHYTSSLATPSTDEGCSCEPSAARDMAVTVSTRPEWSFGNGSSQRTPWGIRMAINWAKNRYNNYPMFLTENGYAGTDAEGLNDFNRISYVSTFMRGTLRAANDDNCNLIGYALWSLLDNYEWIEGYGTRFGLSYTHYEDPNLKRVPKKSSSFVRQIMTTKKVQYYALTDS